MSTLLSLRHNDCSFAIRSNDMARFLATKLNELKRNKPAQIEQCIDTTFTKDKCFCTVKLTLCSRWRAGISIPVENGQTKRLDFSIVGWLPVKKSQLSAIKSALSSSLEKFCESERVSVSTVAVNHRLFNKQIGSPIFPSLMKGWVVLLRNIYTLFKTHQQRIQCSICVHVSRSWKTVADSISQLLFWF